jgi:hypothetical protein
LNLQHAHESHQLMAGLDFLQHSKRQIAYSLNELATAILCDEEPLDLELRAREMRVAADELERLAKRIWQNKDELERLR